MSELLPSLTRLPMGPLLLGASSISTSQTALVDHNDVSTSYLFVRQLGNTFGVTAATVLFDRRQTRSAFRTVGGCSQPSLNQESSFQKLRGGGNRRQFWYPSTSRATQTTATVKRRELTIQTEIKVVRGSVIHPVAFGMVRHFPSEVMVCPS